MVSGTTRKQRPLELFHPPPPPLPKTQPKNIMSSCSESHHHQPMSSNEEGEEAACTTAMLLGQTAAVSMALKAAIELDVLEIIARAGRDVELSPTEIAAGIPTTNPRAATTLDRIMSFLTCYQVFTCSFVPGEDGSVQRRYGLAPAGRYLVKNQDGVSLAPLVLMNQDKVLLDSWQHLKYAVLEGVVPFTKAHGMTAFEYHGTDPRWNEFFNHGMSNHSTIVLKRLLDTYKGFVGIKMLVDVGGGIGATLQMILSRYPHIKGINFDLPHVISDAPTLPGIEHVGGDMFAAVPTGDAIIMKWILHNWSDEHCLKLLKNCWNALPEFGKVISVEHILPDAPNISSMARNAFYVDICMLTHFVGGKARTENESKTLATQAGFSRFKVVSHVFNIAVMELYK